MTRLRVHSACLQTENIINNTFCLPPDREHHQQQQQLQQQQQQQQQQQRGLPPTTTATKSGPVTHLKHDDELSPLAPGSAPGVDEAPAGFDLVHGHHQVALRHVDALRTSVRRD